MNKPRSTISLKPGDLLPHRPPMLLLDEVINVDDSSARAMTTVRPDSLFYIEDKGIPAWVGIEFMGQTAALIAGFQKQQGVLGAHTGFLLGCRRYEVTRSWFEPGSRYLVQCRQQSILGESLASFQCCIVDQGSTSEEQPIASAVLTVFRQALTGDSN